jgi:hypothetical protein
MSRHPIAALLARKRAHSRSKRRTWTEWFSAWQPERDVTVTGVLTAPAIEIPRGVHLHVAGDLRLQATGPLVMAELPKLVVPRVPRPSHLLILRSRSYVELDGQRYAEPQEIVVSTWTRHGAGMPIRILIQPYYQAAGRKAA